MVAGYRPPLTDSVLRPGDKCARPVSWGPRSGNEGADSAAWTVLRPIELFRPSWKRCLLIAIDGGERPPYIEDVFFEAGFFPVQTECLEGCWRLVRTAHPRGWL